MNSRVAAATKKTNSLIDTKWQHWLASILLTVLFPLLPLALEKMISNSISEASLLIAATIYACALSLTSNSVLVMSVGVLVSILLSVFYGIITAKATPSFAYGEVVAWVSIVAFGAIHAIERFQLHVTEGRDFLSFRSAEE